MEVGESMRLIDADALIEEMRKWYWDKGKQKAAEQDSSPMDLFTNLAITTVMEQPTVCDVNKVIEEMKDCAIEFELFGMCSDYIELSHAIEFLKGGWNDK